MQFGRLGKLRYLDMKGNPLLPTLAKIVGPCLTSKDCMNAAKAVVPFMLELEQKFEVEKKKQEEFEAKRKEEEANEIREQIRLAKKAARKERVMRERQEKEVDAGKVESKESEPETESHDSIKVARKSSSSPSSSSFFTFLKTFISVAILFVFIFVIFLKFLPEDADKVLSLLPQQQQTLLRYTFEKIDGSVFGIFQKVLNLYKM